MTNESLNADRKSLKHADVLCQKSTRGKLQTRFLPDSSLGEKKKREKFTSVIYCLKFLFYLLRSQKSLKHLRNSIKIAKVWEWNLATSESTELWSEKKRWRDKFIKIGFLGFDRKTLFLFLSKTSRRKRKILLRTLKERRKKTNLSTNYLVRGFEKSRNRSRVCADF